MDRRPPLAAIGLALVLTTVASPGDGPGPRCMVPHVKNVILASGGFEPRCNSGEGAEVSGQEHELGPKRKLGQSVF